MIFFRSSKPGPPRVRGRGGNEGFTFIKESEYYAAHVVVNSERAAELFHALLDELPPAVDVVIEDLRSKKSWKGEQVALPDVREAMARLKVPLASHGGVEVAIYSSEDQLTLNGYLELFIYARTDRWLYLLLGKGLEEQRRVRTRSWKFKAEDFPPAPELQDSIAAAVERLGLTPA